MAISVTHATQSATPDSGDGKISSNAWNEGHTITGLGTAAEHDTSYFALSAHTHVIADVTGLQAALDGKQPAGTYLTTIVSADVTTALGYTPTSVTGLTGTQSVAAFKTGLSLVKGDVGLGNCDNTSDANKPVSTATQTALDGKLTVTAGTGAYTDYLKTEHDFGLYFESAATGAKVFVDVGANGVGGFYSENSDGSHFIQFGYDINVRSRFVIVGSHAFEFDTSPYVATNKIYHAGDFTLDTDTTLAANSDTKVATQKATKTYVDAKAPNASYRTILDCSGSHTAAKTAGTYGFGHGDPLAVSGTGTLYPLNTIYIASADFPSSGGLSPKLRIRGQLYCNDVAPTGTYTFALVPITRPATSGAAGLVIYTLGAAVSGSSPSAISTPAADSSNNVVGSDFSLPADGHYALALITTGTVAASAHLHVSAQLQMRNA